MPAIIIEWSWKSIANDTHSTADVEHVAQPSVQQLDGDEVRPDRVAVDVSMTAVQD